MKKGEKMQVSDDIRHDAQDKLLYSKIDDMIEKAEKGRLAFSSFLTPGEIAQAEKYLTYGKCPVEYLFEGGYDDAERKMLVLLPDYLDKEYLDKSELFKAVFIKISGYAELDHRAYLGSLMNLSIKRETLGDIIVTKEGAIVFCTLPVASMLADNPSPLERVGKDKVSLAYADETMYKDYKRSYERLVAVMASLRLDCAVASFAGLSRASAQERIAHGMVQLNYREELSSSAEIKMGDTLSIRGTGKFIIEEIGGETRSGRLKVNAKRYV
ncbi:MAG: hypothetical protein J6M35_09400 [Clostridia bacterium]|nr:hypothetical protein [Clostridia bacterium]